jgi:hypothetical protein
MKKKSILVHSCCAPCSSFVFQKLFDDGYLPTLYFYNPNIHPIDEYLIRCNELIKFAEKQGISLIIEEPDCENWFDTTKGMENEPEKGSRCSVCFEMRLGKTAQKSKELGFDIFTTVLTISPHKSSLVINKIGENIASGLGVTFLKEDFKKNDGFKKSVELSRVHDFYRQKYCGCLYSQKK